MHMIAGWALHWIQSNSGLAWIGSLVLGISAVGAAIHKWSPVVRRYIKISREGLDLIDTLLDAVQDDKITPEEIQAIVTEVQHFKNSLKK